MARFSVTLDSKRLEAKLTKLERQVLPAATVRTVNNLAYPAQATVQKFMTLRFDRPTPFVIRGVKVDKATPQVPAAEVYVAEGGNKTGDPESALIHHTRGGARRRKRSEIALERLGLLGRNEAIVPGDALKLDRYGNIPRARMIQILSQLKAFSEVGFQANVTARSRARKPNRAQYFSPNPATRNRMPRGVYQRYGRKRRRAKPVLMFVRQPRYSRSFDFHGVVRQDVRRRMDREFHRALAFELRRAGLVR